VLKLGQSLDDLGKDFDASILLYPDSNDDQVIMATRDNGSIFLHLHDGGLCGVFGGEFKSAVFNILVRFSLD
jgi:hypothetical protein